MVCLSLTRALTTAAVMALTLISSSVAAQVEEPAGWRVSVTLDKKAALATCPTVPGEYWQCISDCLFILCPLGASGCVKTCDYKCGLQYVPGFPNCDPGQW